MKHDTAWRTKVIIAFAAVYIIWGSTYLAIRIGVQQLPPALFAGLRFVAACAVRNFPPACASGARSRSPDC